MPSTYYKGFTALLLMFSLLPAAATEEWHTRPDQWKEARNYHRPFDPAFEPRIRFETTSEPHSPQQMTLSPNGAYWFFRGAPDFSREGPWHTVVTIFIEREKLLRLSLMDHGNAHPQLRWINEKLLYVEVWWGRILGSVLILDVERGAVIHREMVHGGGIAFQQWSTSEREQKEPQRSPVPKP